MGRLERPPYSYREDPAVPALPESPVILVMDGDCALCTRGARVIARADTSDRVRIATVNSKAGQALLNHYGLEPGDPWSWLALIEGRAHTGSHAIIAVGRQLAWPWPALAWFGGLVPPFLREPLYRWVARNRIRWFGRADMCAVPEPGLRRRLIEP